MVWTRPHVHMPTGAPDMDRKGNLNSLHYIYVVKYIENTLRILATFKYLILESFLLRSFAQKMCQITIHNFQTKVEKLRI